MYLSAPTRSARRPAQPIVSRVLRLRVGLRAARRAEEVAAVETGGSGHGDAREEGGHEVHRRARAPPGAQRGTPAPARTSGTRSVDW